MKRRGFLGLFGVAAAAVPAMALASKLPDSRDTQEYSNPHAVTKRQLGETDEEDLATLVERVRRRNCNNQTHSLLRFQEALRRR